MVARFTTRAISNAANQPAFRNLGHDAYNIRPCLFCSLVAQRDHGIDLGRTPGGDITSQSSDAQVFKSKVLATGEKFTFTVGKPAHTRTLLQSLRV
jgi:hypothetical protein